MLNTGRGLVASGFNADTGSISVGTSYPFEVQGTYSLRHITVHTPSEHTFLDVSGASVKMPLELQLFHEGGQADGGGETLAAVAIGFYSDAQGSSSFLEALSQGGLPMSADLKTMVNREAPQFLDFTELFGNGVSFWQYEGSLTTPPCDPGVTWLVREVAVRASEDDISAFSSAIGGFQSLNHVAEGVGGNARMLQPVAGRSVSQLFTEDVAQLPAAAESSTGFQKAVNDAAAAVNEAKETLGISTDKAAADKDSRNSVVALTDYEICTSNLARTEEDLVMAEKRRNAKCGTSAQATPTAAVAVQNSVENLCATLAKNVHSLKMSAEAQVAECKRLATKEEYEKTK
jgi:carbonic anhydrase